MRRYMIPILVAAALAAAGTEPYGGKPDAMGHEQGLTLETAIERARKNHPGLRVLEEDIASAGGVRTSAGAWANPEVNLGPGVKHTSEGGASRTRFHGELGISQVLEFPGKRSLRVFLAEGDLRLRRIALEGFRSQLEIEVRRAFIQAQIARQAADLRSEQARSAQTFLQAARKRVEGGYASDFEALRAQADLIAARKALAEAMGEIRSAKLSLAALMGNPSDTVFEPLGNLDAGAFPPSDKDPLPLALAGNAGLRALSLQAGLAEKGIRAAELAYKPDLTLSPSVEYSADERVYGLSLSLPLPVWNRGKGEALTARAGHRKALAELEKLKQEITLSVRIAQDKVRLSEEQLALYAPDFLEGLKSIMARAEKAYGQGATTLFLYLEARRGYYDGLADYGQVLRQWAESHLELEAAIGAPPAYGIHADGEGNNP